MYGPLPATPPKPPSVAPPHPPHTISLKSPSRPQLFERFEGDPLHTDFAKRLLHAHVGPITTDEVLPGTEGAVSPAAARTFLQRGDGGERAWRGGAAMASAAAAVAGGCACARARAAAAGFAGCAGKLQGRGPVPQNGPPSEDPSTHTAGQPTSPTPPQQPPAARAGQAEAAPAAQAQAEEDELAGME